MTNEGEINVMDKEAKLKQRYESSFFLMEIRSIDNFLLYNT